MAVRINIWRGKIEVREIRWMFINSNEKSCIQALEARMERRKHWRSWYLTEFVSLNDQRAWEIKERIKFSGLEVFCLVRIMISLILGLSPYLPFQKIQCTNKRLKWGVLRVETSGGMYGLCKTICQSELYFSIWPWTLLNTTHSNMILNFKFGAHLLGLSYSSLCSLGWADAIKCCTGMRSSEEQLLSED